jgi:hypothetical protein
MEEGFLSYWLLNGGETVVPRRPTIVLHLLCLLARSSLGNSELEQSVKSCFGVLLNFLLLNLGYRLWICFCRHTRRRTQSSLDLRLFLNLLFVTAFLLGFLFLLFIFFSFRGRFFLA